MTEAYLAHRFAAQDLVGTIWGVLVFAMVLYAPGYVVGFASDFAGFRSAPLRQRCLWSVALSIVIVPIVSYLGGLLFGLIFVLALTTACSVATALLLLLFRKVAADESALPRGERLLLVAVLLGWTAFVLLMLNDFQWGNKLYFSVALADQSYRVAFTDALARSLPPANPLYFAYGPAAMHYYYFWYILCAAVMKLAHISARQAFTASSIWAGFCLLAVTKLYATRFFHWQRRTQWIALGLLAVSGADLIPSLGNAVLQPLNGDIEWWSVDPIDAWPDSLLWVPHHVAAVICCLVGFLCLWSVRKEARPRQKVASIVIAAAAYASAFGLSVYVACGFAMILASWVSLLLVRRSPQFRTWGTCLALPGVISAVLLTPFLLELHRTTPALLPGAPGVGSVTAPRPFSLSVRRIIDSELVTGAPIFAGLKRSHPLLLDQTVRLLLLIPGLAMELGFFGMVLVWLWRARRRSSPAWTIEQRTSLFFAFSGLALSLFVSSSLITNNDFGYRVVMLPQFFWSLLAADLLGSWLGDGAALVPLTNAKRQTSRALLGLGVASTVYGALLLRAWLPLEEHRPGNGFSQLPEEAFQIRAAFDRLHAHAPANAVIAFRPIDPELNRNSEVMTPNEFYQRLLVADTGMQMLNAEGKCAVHFGGNANACTALQLETVDLYSAPLPNAIAARNFCRRFGVDYLTLSPRDPAWSVASAGWPVELPVIGRQPRFLIVACNEASR